MKLRLPLQLKAAVLACLALLPVTSYSSDSYSVSLGSTASGTGLGLVATSEWFSTNTTGSFTLQGNDGVERSTLTIDKMSVWSYATSPNSMLHGYSSNADLSLQVNDIGFDTYDVYVYFAETNYKPAGFAPIVVNGQSYTGSTSGSVQGDTVWGTWNGLEPLSLLGSNALLIEGLTAEELTIGFVAGSPGIHSVAGFQIVKSATETLYSANLADKTTANWSDAIWTKSGITGSWGNLTETSNSKAGITASSSGTTLIVGGTAGEPVKMGTLSLESGKLTLDSGVIEMGYREKILVSDGAELTLGDSLTLNSTNLIFGGTGTIYYNTSATSYEQSSLGSENTLIFKDGMNVTLKAVASIGKLKTGTGKLTLGASGVYNINGLVFETGDSALTGLTATLDVNGPGLNLGTNTSLSSINMQGGKLVWDQSKTLSLGSLSVLKGSNNLGQGTINVTGKLEIKSSLLGFSSSDSLLSAGSLNLWNGTVSGISLNISGGLDGYGGDGTLATIRNSSIVVDKSYTAGVSSASGFHTVVFENSNLLVKGSSTNNSVAYGIGLGNWGFGSSMTLDGGKIVTVNNFAITLDGPSSLDIKNGGFVGAPELVMNVRGNLSGNADNGSTLTLDSGILVLGAGGITTKGNVTAASITIKQGTLASSADEWNSSLNMTIGSASSGQATIDTEKYDISGDDYTYAKNGKGAKITLSGILSGPGGLVKDGAGWLTLSGTGSNTYSGGTTLNAGGIEIAKESALGQGNLTINASTFLLLSSNATVGGNLVLNGKSTITMPSGNLLKVTGNVTYGTDAVTTLKLTGDFTTGSSTPTILVQADSYNFSDDSSHWNIRFTKRSSAHIVFGNGSISFTDLQYTAGENITWNGGNSGMWESIGSGWIKTGTSQDEVYYDADNVTFSPDHAGTVTLQEQLAPGKMTVNGDYTFSGIGSLNGSFDLEVQGGNVIMQVSVNCTGGNTTVSAGSLWVSNADAVMGQITLGAEGTLQLGSSSSILTDFDHQELKEGGNLQIWGRGNLSASGGGDGNHTTFKVGEGFHGTIEMKSGLINWETSENVLMGNAEANGPTLILNGGGVVTTGTPETQVYNPITIGANGAVIRSYGTKYATYYGPITGSGKISHTDGGYVTFKDMTGFSGEFVNERGSVTFDSAIHFSNLTSNSSNDKALITLTGKAGSSVTGTIKLAANSSLTMDIGKENTLETTNFLVSGTAAQTITLTSGTLKVTGTNNARKQSDLSFSLNTAGTGSNTTTLHIAANAAIDAADTVLATGWEGNSTINLEGGTINVKGLCSSNPTNAVAINLKSGTVKLGDYGITDYQWSVTGNQTDAKVSLTLGTVEIIAQADLSIDPHRLDDNATDIVTLTDAVTGTTFNTNNHTITVNDCLVGDGKVVKTGAGTLILQKAGTYAGGTVINAGTLRASHASALGASDVTVNEEGILQLTASDPYSNNVVLTDTDSKLLWDTGSEGTLTGTMNGSISGSGILEKTGTGTMKMLSAQTLENFNGTIHVIGGQLQLGNAVNGQSVSTGKSRIILETGSDLFLNGGDNARHIVAGDVTVQGKSRISLYAGFNGQIALDLQGAMMLNNDLTLVKTWAKQIGISGKLSGKGNLVYDPTIKDNAAWQENNKLIISSANTDYEGTVRMIEATTTAKKRPGWLILQNDDALSSAQVELVSTQAYLVVDTGNATLKGLTGSGYVSSGEGSNTLTLDITGSLSNTFNGTIGDKMKTTGENAYAANGSLSLVKNGGGELILSGANSYTGGTTVQAGTLTITNDSSLGSGNVHLGSGATLKSGIRWDNSLVLDGEAAVESSHDNALFAGSTSGNNTLVKKGASLLTFCDAPADEQNDGTTAHTAIYQHGDTIVSEGELQLGILWKTYDQKTEHRFGTGTVYIEDTAKFSLGLSYNTYSTVKFASDITTKNGGTLEVLDGNHELTGTLTFGQNAGDTTTFQDAGWGAKTYGTVISGKVSGHGTLNIVNGDQGASDNLLTLSNASNDFNGTVNVHNVRLRLNSSLEGASINLTESIKEKPDNTALVVNGDEITI